MEFLPFCRKESLGFLPLYLIAAAPYGYTVKKGSDFPVPSRDVINQNSPWQEIIKLFPARESLVSDGEGKIANLFLHTAKTKCQKFETNVPRK
jgi:hypothetical protein